MLLLLLFAHAWLSITVSKKTRSGPGIDGLDTYKKILEFHPNQKTIITSGFSETERVKEVKNLGAGRYIRKPYTMEKIGIAVRDELEK
jgi:two-component system cell cycle sensor histidine kinase/response regulator CckA